MALGRPAAWVLRLAGISAPFCSTRAMATLAAFVAGSDPAAYLPKAVSISALLTGENLILNGRFSHLSTCARARPLRSLMGEMKYQYLPLRDSYQGWGDISH